MVEIVIFNFAEQHLRGSAPDLKRGNTLASARYHLPAHLQTVVAGDGFRSVRQRCRAPQ